MSGTCDSFSLAQLAEGRSGAAILIFGSATILVALAAAPAYFLFRYFASVKKHARDLDERFSKYKVTRDKSATDAQIKCLELHPAFVEEAKREGFRVMSLGQYLSQLRPTANSAKFLKKELELTISNLLVEKLGRTYGGVLLPILGTDSVDSALSGLANEMASWTTDRIHAGDSGPASQDMMALRFSLQELVALLNVNQAHNSPSSDSEKATSLFLKGEAGYGELSYHNQERHGELGFKNPFVMEKEFKNTIADMAKLSKEKDASWEPDDDSHYDPYLINERILPDLHIGWGSARCTHTKLQCLENRLLGFLLTRLSGNFHRRAKGNTRDLFEVRWFDAVCRFPDELIQAFIDNGHTVTVCPRATMAMYAFTLCAKEKDGSFTNIPTGIHLSTGVERIRDGRAAHFLAPHGGLDVEISGPLVGTERSCDVQFYLSAEGMTGFFANQDADVPWLKRSPLAEIYPDDTAVRAVRMAGLVGTVFNAVGADMNLPCGGYGVLGACNDSSTLIDFALRGETSAYPLFSTGRYLNHIVSYFVELREDLETCPEMATAVEDIGSLVKATCNLPSDLHVAPSTLPSTAERFIATYPKCVFQLTEDSKQVMREMADFSRNACSLGK